VEVSGEVVTDAPVEVMDQVGQGRTAGDERVGQVRYVSARQQNRLGAQPVVTLGVSIVADAQDPVVAEAGGLAGTAAIPIA